MDGYPDATMVVEIQKDGDEYALFSFDNNKMNL